MNQVAPVWFKHERIRDGLYLISEPHYNWLNRPNIWLVRGRDADMLVDTGLGVSRLKLYLADLLDKHLKVVASHVHDRQTLRGLVRKYIEPQQAPLCPGGR